MQTERPARAPPPDDVELVRALARRGRAGAGRRPRRPGCRRRRPRTACAQTAPTRCPRRSRRPGWLRFLEQYRSYMQIILVAAAVVSLADREWGTAVLLLALTVLNAVIGLRQEGKAESAMNALKSMMKATARVRRDGDGGRDPRRAAGRRRRRAARRRRPGAGRRPDHRGQRAADRRVGAHRGEHSGGQGRRARLAGSGSAPATRPTWRS